jgi:hypothetical protein
MKFESGALVLCTCDVWEDCADDDTPLPNDRPRLHHIYRVQRAFIHEDVVYIWLYEISNAWQASHFVVLDEENISRVTVHQQSVRSSKT